MKLLKNYLLFTSLKYRLLALIILPLGFLGSEIALSYMTEPELHRYIMIQVLVYMVMFEVMADYWMFGGICAKDEVCANFLKTAYDGLHFMQRGLVGDMVRRAIYFGIFGVVSCVCCGELYPLVAATCGYLAVTMMLIVGRHISIFQMYMFCGVAASIIAGVLLAVTMIIGSFMDRNRGSLVQFVVLAAASTAVSAVAVWHAMKCICKEEA